MRKIKPKTHTMCITKIILYFIFESLEYYSLMYIVSYITKYFTNKSIDDYSHGAIHKGYILFIIFFILGVILDRVQCKRNKNRNEG